MSEGVDRSQLPSSRRSFRGRWVPFWGMQASEIAVAFVFVDLSVHVANGGLLVATAVALTVLAITARGPLGIFRICGQRLHLLLVMMLSGAAALAPIIPALRPDIQGIIVIEFGAVGLLRVSTLTRMDASRPAGSPGRRRGGSRVIDTTATVVTAGAPPATTGPGARSGAPAAGSVARQAGRASGAAVASGKRVATKYRPEVEDHAKRTVRGIGKIAGRMSSRLVPPSHPDD
jgi:hypothetical protein